MLQSVATVTMEVKKIISWFINITKCCLDFGAVGGGGGIGHDSRQWDVHWEK